MIDRHTVFEIHRLQNLGFKERKIARTLRLSRPTVKKYIENPNACTLVHTMNIIGNKWKPILIYLLSNGSLRFGKLLMLTPGISRKVLTSQLRELEEDGIIIREEFKELPPRVEYSLSEKGLALLPILRSLSQWAETMYPDIAFEECRIANGKSYVEE